MIGEYDLNHNQEAMAYTASNRSLFCYLTAHASILINGINDMDGSGHTRILPS